ncbi:leucine-rich repeat domain-containing protein [Parabacteroides johnsonii]|uniref:leucine-rich repeat domain-containing protein n=1 Tax=Parabacteroides johnsonii TaxID=387661 RepID=UPI00307A4CD1
MKRWLFFIMLCTCGLFDSFTAKSQEALYIFRNDEELLTPFFYSDIDSITYSAYDEAGKVHNEYVTQVVHTPDSIYRIPLAVIDSITFVQPETIYQPDVYELDARYLPYVKTVDSLTITFTSSLPSDLKPSKGDVLYNFAYQTPFERGFLGNVKSVHLNADEIIVDCDLADITEVFKQYVSYQIHKPDEIQTKAVVSDTTETISQDFSLTYSHDIGKIGEFSIDGDCSYSSIIRTKVLVLGEEKHICIQSNDEYKLDTGFDLAIKGEAKDAISILFPIRFPVGILECSIQPQICYSLNASASLTAAHSSCTLKIYHEYGVINGKEYDGKHEWSLTSESDFSKDVTVEGSFLLGANFQLGIGLPMQSLGVGFDLQLAPQFTIDGSISPAKNPGAEINTDLYEIKKDANIRLDAVANISPCAFVKGEKLWSDEDGKNHFSLNKTVPIGTRYLFPEFSELVIQTNMTGSADVSSMVSRDLIFPQQIGYALYDDNKELKEIVYDSDKLQLNKDYKNPLNLRFDHLKHNTQYTVYPIIQHQGQEFLANPSKAFKIDLNINITTGNTTDISTNVAVCHGRIYPIENTSGVTYGICYGMTAALSAGTNAIIPATADENGSFSVHLNGLQENSVYYYCAYMSLNGEYQYGEVKNFKTDNSKEEGSEEQPGDEDIDSQDLRALLIRFYKDTNGDGWKRNDNWCSDKPIDEWYGVDYDSAQNLLGLDLTENNLVGTINLKGCKSLEYLFCSKNVLTDIDVSNCTRLSNLDCAHNHLTNINVVGCSNANFHLNCFNNQITGLDLSGCINLDFLDCNNNRIERLDVSGCKWLEKLRCANNRLVLLNITKCSNLAELDCYNNQLVNLDFSDCNHIKRIICYTNKINAEIPKSIYTTNTYGWWYPGEPEKGYHGE